MYAFPTAIMRAATAVAFGLPYEEALKAVTLNPAQIWGVADKIGNWLAAFEAAVGPHTAAVMIECVQGESGVVVPPQPRELKRSTR